MVEGNGKELKLCYCPLERTQGHTSIIALEVAILLAQLSAALYDMFGATKQLALDKKRLRERKKQMNETWDQMAQDVS